MYAIQTRTIMQVAASCLLMAAIPAHSAIITSATAGLNTQNGGSTSSASTNFSDANYKYSATAGVNATYNNLSGTTHAIISGNACLVLGNCANSGSIPGAITATLADSLFINAPGGSGTVLFNYRVGLGGDLNTGGTLKFLNKTYQTETNQLSPDSQTLAFSNGVAIPLSLSLNFGGAALAGIGAGPAFSDQASNVNFALTSIVVFDNGGNPIGNFRYSSASGFDYSLAGGTFMPEPATPMLIGLGMLGFWTLRKARTSRV